MSSKRKKSEDLSELVTTSAAVACYDPRSAPVVVRATVRHKRGEFPDHHEISEYSRRAASAAGLRQPMVVFPEGTPEYEAYFKGKKATPLGVQKALVCGRNSESRDAMLVVSVVALPDDKEWERRRRFEEGAKAKGVCGPYCVFPIPLDSQDGELPESRKALVSLITAMHAEQRKGVGEHV